MKTVFLFFVLIAPGLLYANSPDAVVPLFPVNSENGELLYESPELTSTVAPDEGGFYPELIQFNNWTVTSTREIENSTDLTSRIQCVIEYTGEVSLSAAQLHACKPVVLFLPTSGITYKPKAPSPSWGRAAPKRREGSEGPQNLVLLMIDTLRDDCTPPYGHPFVIAPHLDLLASMGTTFTNAYAASSSTRPSIGTFFSGLHPIAHGAERHALTGARLRPGFPVIAEYMSSMGFETAGAVSNAQITSAYGFERGFQRYHCPIRDHEVTEMGMKELQRLSEPFFLYLHYIAPHQPYEPAGLYNGLYEGRTPYPEMDAYLAEVTQDDRRVGRILSELARQGLLDRTLIWTLSDHGEEFWEHGWNGHGANLYEESVRTVSIVNSPPYTPPGQTIETPVMHADVLPTLQDFYQQSAGFLSAGLSLKPFLQSQKTAVLADFIQRPVFLHHGGGTKADAHPSDKQAILHDGEKWVWWTQTNAWEHYQLDQDPQEANDLAKSASGAISSMQESLMRVNNIQHQLAERFSTPGGDGQGINLSRQEMENLRDLGYVK
ncbi:MAG: sulfatase [Candidatus Hinthialibacter antarcticus]|nr:sulfatase [Candidatus Hinthialibacter antarcticus]